jgi:hypothetical protein
MPATAVELVPVSDGAHGWSGFIEGRSRAAYELHAGSPLNETAGRAG